MVTHTIEKAVGWYEWVWLGSYALGVKASKVKEVTFKLALDVKYQPCENLVEEHFRQREQHMPTSWGGTEFGIFEEWPLDWSRVAEGVNGGRPWGSGHAGHGKPQGGVCTLFSLKLEAF